MVLRRTSRFANPTALFIQPDHYVFRMLYSQGVSLESLGIGGTPADPRSVWHIFAQHYYLFRGHAHAHVDGLRVSFELWTRRKALAAERRRFLRHH